VSTDDEKLHKIDETLKQARKRAAVVQKRSDALERDAPCVHSREV
jgi:hypothetical protein